MFRKHIATGLYPRMRSLPSERTAGNVFPFQNTGMDYYGPVEVKVMRPSLKRWCCLFTCLSTRAVHIEVVPNLEAKTCLAAITRFINRRGKPQTIISDNGTNFVGAAKEIKQYLDDWNQSSIKESLAQRQIKWKFNPPGAPRFVGAPHFGGVWERLVNRVKKAMISIMGSRTLTEDILNTTTCLVEQTLNARPLTSVSDDPNDLEARTPNQFSFGRASVGTPFLSDAHKYTNLRKVFKKSQPYTDMIWTRWSKECLPEWNKRDKWNKLNTRELKVNDLVWVVDESVKRSHYKIGRIIETYPGNDGVVRSATVKTQDGTLKRTQVKLAPVYDEGVFTTENRAGDVGAHYAQPPCDTG